MYVELVLVAFVLEHPVYYNLEHPVYYNSRIT